MLNQETLVDSFFIAAVETVCKRFGYQMGREIVVGPDRQLCINDPDMSSETRIRLAEALEEAVGKVSI